VHDLASHPGDLFWRGPAHPQADWLGSYGRYFCVVPVYSKTASYSQNRVQLFCLS